MEYNGGLTTYPGVFRVDPTSHNLMWWWLLTLKQISTTIRFFFHPVFMRLQTV